MDVRGDIGRSSGRSTPPPIDLPVDLNGNLGFFMLELIWADQMADLPPNFTARYHGMYIMGCIWQPLWILQEKVGILFMLNLGSNQSVSTVECCQSNPLNIPNTPPDGSNATTPLMTISDFTSESSYLPDLTCNMDVRVHISRSTGRSTPPLDLP